MAARGTRNGRQRSKAEREFVSEAEEILERMRSDLLDLADASAGGGEADPELVNRLFRSAHSLKGLSGMFGLDAMSDLAHHLEDVLDKLRMGQIALDAESGTLLDESVQLMAGTLASVGDSEAPADSTGRVGDLLRRIDLWANRSAPAADALEEIDLDPVILRALTEYEEHRLREAVRRDRHVHVIDVAYEIHSFDSALAELTDAIRCHGELLSTLPSPGEDSGSQIRFSLLSATDLDAVEFATRVDVPEDALRTARTPSAGARPTVPESAPVAPPPDAALAGGDVETLKSLGGTVRVDIHKLDELMNLVGELVIQRRALGSIAARLRGQASTARIGDELEKIHQGLDRKLEQLQGGVLEVRMVPLRQIFEKLSRVVRRLRRDTAKPVNLEIRGADTELDKLIVEELVDPLVHVMRNAFDHAIEPAAERSAAGKDPEGLIRIEATQRGNDVLISVSDDGGGIDDEAVWQRAVASGLVDPSTPLGRRERLDLVFSAGLTTCDEVSETSGRGVGMDVVRANVTALGGIVEIDSEVGVGTTVTMTLPITLAIIQALLIGVGDQRYALPLNAVHETLLVGSEEIQRSQGREILNLRGDPLPLCRLAQEFGLPEGDVPEKQSVVVVGLGELRAGFLVDRLDGQQDAVIKAIQGPLQSVRGIAGATELGDGAAVLVLDVAGLIEDALRSREAA